MFDLGFASAESMGHELRIHRSLNDLEVRNSELTSLPCLSRVNSLFFDAVGCRNLSIRELTRVQLAK